MNSKKYSKLIRKIKSPQNKYIRIIKYLFEIYSNNIKSEIISLFSKQSKFKEIIVLNTFTIYPPLNGGQIRLYEIYRRLAKKYTVKFLNLICGDRKIIKTFSKNFIEYDIPVSAQHFKKIRAYEKKTGECLHDVIAGCLTNHEGHYRRIVEKNCGYDKLIVFAHPYMYPIAKNIQGKHIRIYEALNLEYNLKKHMLKNIVGANYILGNLLNYEKELSEKANFILAMSSDERKLFSKQYKIDKKKILIIPNGVDCKKIKFCAAEEKAKIKRKLGITDKKVCIFLGSGHKPNLDSIKYIIDQARIDKDILFFIVGSVCNLYDAAIGNKLPENVLFFYVIPDKKKELLTKAADFAINPMFYGGGTNLKIFEYIAAGLPVITTKIGMRGIASGKIDIYPIDKEINPIDLNKLANLDLIKNRRYVEQNFDWDIIAQRYLDLLKSINY